MCGIAGLWHPKPSLDAETLAEQARRMSDAIAHRGPDDRGSWVDADAGVALAHRRLSIIDLSAQGHQPMVSASGRYVITYNGEIYNYAEVRRELDASGAAPAWRGHSDTEVMLAAFERFGVEGALAHFNGMFAVALWDREDRVLHLARDRMGEKPLYYGMVAGTFAFASELKGLRALPRFAADVDPDALALFLRFNYVPAPWSIYRGIAKLSPGARAEIRVGADGAFIVREAKYFDVAAVARDALRAPPIDAREALPRLRSELERAVSSRMVSDVPIGAFLSGGIDSSLVVALMQQRSSQPVRTFTIGFADARFDEAPFARHVAAHLRTDHTELYVRDEEARATIPLLPAMYDEPFADSSQIPTYLVSRLARSHVTVSLSGDGGDELFFGYERYVRSAQLDRAPKLLRRAAAYALRAAPSPAVDWLARGLQRMAPPRLRVAHPAEKLRKLAAALECVDPRERYRGLLSFWQGVPPTDAPSHVQAPLERFASEDRDLTLPAWMMLVDQRTYLPDDVLAKVDRASMAVALEARVPLLDHRLVAFAWSLPLSLKLSGGRGKHLLRELLCEMVPRALVERPKQGFAVPLETWLRSPLRDWAESLLDERRMRDQGYLDATRIRRRWRELIDGDRYAHNDLWSVLMFQAWLDEAHAR
jgi:asparagine synthase (glutamine-hydrolysing)